MGLLSDLLLFPVTGPVRGLLFVVEQLKEQVDEEVAGESSRIEEELLDLGLRYELGELSEQAYAAQEDALLARLNDLRQQQDDWVDTTADGWAETTESEFEQDEYAIADGDTTDQA